MKVIKSLLGAAAIAALLVTSFSAKAQENGNRDENGKIVRGAYLTNGFGSNWFIGAGAGVNTFFAPSNVNPGLGLSTEVFVGKWFTPSVGARLGWHGFDDAFKLGTVSQKAFYNSLHADVLWNISNAFSGYKETRFWDIILYPSFEVGVSKVKSATAKNNFEYGAGFGWLNDLRLGKCVSFFLDFRVLVTKGDFLVNTGNKFGFLPSATAGFTFNLGKSGFQRHTSAIPVVVPLPFTADQYNALKDKVAQLEKENAELRAKIDSLEKALPDTVYAESHVAPASATLYFDCGKAVLSERELAHLEYFAKSALTKNSKITVVGSADKQTGSAARNQFLSEQRAKYVKNILVKKYGLVDGNITINAEGSRNNVFDTPAKNRVVTIK